MATKHKLLVVAALAFSALADNDSPASLVVATEVAEAFVETPQLKNAELHKPIVMASKDTLVAELMDRVEKLDQRQSRELEFENRAVEVNHERHFAVSGEARELEMEQKHASTQHVTCADVANRYEHKAHAETTLCHEAKASGADPLCCKENSCCVDHNTCSLEEVFGALNMTCGDDGSFSEDSEGDGEELSAKRELSGPKALVRKEPRWARTEIDAQGGLVMRGEEKLVELHQGGASTKAVQRFSAEQEEQLWQQRVELLKKQVRNQEVEDSLLKSDELGGVLEVKQHIKFMKEMHAERPRARIPIYTKDLGNLDSVTFEDSLASAGAGVLSSLFNGEVPDYKEIVGLGLSLVAAVNPVLGVFAGILTGLLGGDADEALIKIILEEVDKKVRKNNRRVLANELKDLAEELAWVPGMLRKDTGNKQTSLSYYLALQHDLATSRTNVFHEVCIAHKPWTNLRKIWSFQTQQKDGALIDETTKKSAKLDESLHRKSGTQRAQGRRSARSGTDYSKWDLDECDKWVQDGRTKEVMWTYSMTQLSLLSTIFELKPGFRQEVGNRVKKLANEYAGLMKQTYESFIPYRISQVKKSSYNFRTKYQGSWGFQDKYTDAKFDECRSDLRTLALRDAACHRKYNALVNSLRTQLEKEKTYRVQSLLLYGAAAAGEDIKDRSVPCKGPQDPRPKCRPDCDPHCDRPAAAL